MPLAAKASAHYPVAGSQENSILPEVSIMRALAVTILLALPTAALAGVPATPGPEAGVGAAAMAAVTAGYLFLKRRSRR
jgi:hypothetical protein